MTMQYALTPIHDQNSLEKLRQFLHAHKLPASDITLERGLFVGYYEQDGKLIGSGGLEVYGEIALLRSIAVDEKLRSQMIGKRIVEDLLTRARNLKIKAIYLLTETARDYFLKKGFVDVAREKAPEAIKLSTEFSQVCPASAVVMELVIG